VEQQRKELYEQKAEEFIETLGNVQTVQELGSLINQMNSWVPQDEAERVRVLQLLGRDLHLLFNLEEDENRKIFYAILAGSLGAQVLIDFVSRLLENFDRVSEDLDLLEGLLEDPFQDGKMEELP